MKDYNDLSSTGKRQRRFSQAGMCIGCGKRPPADGSVYCESCRIMHQEHGTDRYSRLVMAHKCANCKKPLPDDWYFVYCPKCKEKKRLVAKERYHRMRDAHICVVCRKPLPEGWTKTRCKACQDAINKDAQDHRRLR